MLRKRFSGLSLVIGGILLAATAAVAGNGVGGVFNLGQVNAVNAQTQLQGTTSTQQLRVANSHTATGSAAIYGQANRGTGIVGSSTSRMGVRALATNTSGVNYGIYATTASRGGLAGFFQNAGTTTDPALGSGIRGLAAGAASDIFSLSRYAGWGEIVGPYGVIGVSSVNGYGVYGLSRKSSGGIGVLGEGMLYGIYSAGHAHVLGNLSVAGTLAKGAGTFKIDHPLDPANKYLSHSFVESPEMKNVYDGIVVTDATGEAVVELPSYFEALNRDPRYQLTVMGVMAQAIVERKIENNRFTIRASEPNVEVSWQVTGIRQDAFAEAHPVVVEEEKALADRRRYLHPEAHGVPASLGIDSAQMAELQAGQVRGFQ